MNKKEKIQVIPQESSEIIRFREIADKKINAYSKRMIEMSNWIAKNPETGFLEFKASKLLAEELKKYGFEVEMGVPDLIENIDDLKIIGGLRSDYTGPSGLPTAFRAKYKGKSESPVIGFLVEYDALRTDPPFHGCLHNTQGPTGISAAIALAHTMEENNIPGSVWVFGTPAEEVGPSAKELMHKAGYFNGVDFFLRSHGPSNATERNPGGYNDMLIRQLNYTFHGKSAHAGYAWLGLSALDAAILFFNGMGMLREHSEPQFRFHGIISKGGTAPNIVPEKAIVPYWVRYFVDETRLGKVSPRKATEMIEKKVKQMNNIARGTALATGCKVNIELLARSTPAISVASLADIAFQYAVDYGAQNIKEKSNEMNWWCGYEESGWVSIDIPGIYVRFNSEGISKKIIQGHTHEYFNRGVSEAGQNFLILSAKVMQAVGLRLVMDEKIRLKVIEEHAMWREKYNEQSN